MLHFLRPLSLFLLASTLTVSAATTNSVAQPAVPASHKTEPVKTPPPKTPVQPVPMKALPVPTAAPAFLDVVSFKVHEDDGDHKMVVSSCPGLLRVDELDDGYSIIYHEQADFYTGLEHRNYTYWEFSWPEVRDAVETSKRGEAHLEELNVEGAGTEIATPSTNAPGTTDMTSGNSTSVPDDSGYVWRPTSEHKKIAGLDCVRWKGDSLTGNGIEVWCFPGPLPQVRAAMELLRKINDPMALVPIRTIVPSQVYPVYDGLIKGGVTPVEIVWGGGDDENERDKNYFILTGISTRDGTLSLFTIPKFYNKTTLVSMDGILIEKKQTP